MKKGTSSTNPDGATEESGDSQPSAFDLIANAMQGNERAEEKSEVTDDESEEVDESNGEELEDESVDEEEAEETDEESEDDSVLSQIDYEALTDEQKRIIAEQIGSGAGKEIGKLRGEKKELEAQLESLQAQLDEAVNAVRPDDSPFSKVTDMKALQEMEQAIRESVKYYRDIERGDRWDINDDGDYGVSVNGKFYAKDQVMDQLDTWHEQLYNIPEQRQRIKELEGMSGFESAEMKKASEEIPWLSNKDSDIYGKYKELVDDSEFQVLFRTFPKTGAKLRRLLAHATNSIEGKSAKKVGKLPLKKAGAKAIGSVGTGATAGKRTSGNKQAVQSKRNIQSGNYSRDDVLGLISNAI